MITEGVLDGQKVMLSYINDAFEPVDEDEATLIVAIFSDGRKVILLNAPDKVTDAKPWDEDKHSRGQPKNAGQFGPGGSSPQEKRAAKTAAAKEKTGRATAALSPKVREQQRQQAIAARSLTVAGRAAEAAKSAAAAVPVKTKKEIKKEDFEKAKIRFMGRGEGGDNAFLKRWNDQIGVEPEVFKKAFLGGVPATMDIYIEGQEFKVNGRLLNKPEDEGGRRIGDYSRFINPTEHSAYSSFFELDSSQQHGDIGKKVLAGNIAMYEALGVDTVKVHANIDVGGYAWAKYGYVPDSKEEWENLAYKLKNKLEYGGGGGSSSGEEADDWNMLSMDQQDRTMRSWMSDSRDDYIESEISNWRENGQPLEDAKQRMPEEFADKSIPPEWVNNAIDEARVRIANEYESSTSSTREGPEIPFSNAEIFDAMMMENYQSKYGDGADDFEFSWDDEKLNAAESEEAKAIDKDEKHKALTDRMRTYIDVAMKNAGNIVAENEAADARPPDYLSEQVDEYMEEHWNELDESERLRMAINYGNADVEYESDDDPVEVTREESNELKAILEDPDPKALWKLSDTAKGKELLLGESWHGTLNLKDPDSYARFKKYVGRVKGEQRAA